MQAAHSHNACNSAIAFINAQLLTLTAFAALLADWIKTGENPPDLQTAATLLSTARGPDNRFAGSLKVFAADSTTQSVTSGWPSFRDADQRLAFALCIPSTNAVVAVASCLDACQISGSRAPEIQFLMHLRDAVLNRNIFRLPAQEYRPLASYGNLVIDAKLDGTPAFADGQSPGLMEPRDTFGLLGYLADMLSRLQGVVSAGDAG